ncbi:hypothetical protein C1M53_09730 [Mesorhizobium sp. Pch-S]|nr:hypothetical protein C1M53_09730 [Mesorhizobium sp. Pch-S]
MARPAPMPAPATSHLQSTIGVSTGMAPRPAYVAPYMAIGLSTIVTGVAQRKHIRHNLETIEEAIHAAVSICAINAPIRVVALAEGALTGFTDEIFDVPHVTAARDIFIDLPGEETEALGKLARHYDTYIIGQCKARWPDVMEDRFFNTLFVIDRKGKLVHRAARTTSGAASAVARRMISTTAGSSCSATAWRPSIRCCVLTTSATSAPSAVPTASIRKRCARSPSAAPRSSIVLRRRCR